ncbi:MAG: Hsp20/alpha crystallin family protein [Oscillatoria sp. PMC 1068.18]|nr:Hsp20/alpha crystallin family protein [Oscillatoria sp. PMC 1076.18]MEC4989043.1 Hsp20/alpha crystallin family protein [Oscillatoria sp. PMC 1068.18]
MMLIRRQPLTEIETLHRQMNQMFSNLATSDNTNKQRLAWTPAVELKNTENHLILKAEIPGVDKKDLDIYVTRDVVVISGEHRFENKQETNGFFRTEFRYGNFKRVINLPVAVENNQVQANFSNGILTLILPKLTTVKNQVVKVNLTETTDSKANLTAVEETATLKENIAEEAVNQEIAIPEENVAEEIVINEENAANNVVNNETDNDPWSSPNSEFTTV